MTTSFLNISDFKISSLDNGKDVFNLQTLRLRDGSYINIPCVTIVGGKKPIVCFAAGQHGNEWNGVYAMHLLANKLANSKILGTIIIIPVANPFAFYQKSRLSNIDHVDLNRTYNLLIRRKPTEILGELLFENIFSKSDYIVDFHTGGPGEYLPHISFYNKDNFKIAQSFLIKYLLFTQTVLGSLTDATNNNSIKSFTIEVGKGRKIDYKSVDYIVSGMINFLKKIKAIKGKPIYNDDFFLFHNKIFVQSPCSGFFFSKVELGQKIKKGQVVGEVNPILDNKTYKIKSPSDGIVIYLRAEEIVDERERLMHIAK